MKQQTITYNGKQIKVMTWDVNTDALYAKLKESRINGYVMTAKDISWLYLNDDQSVQYMENTQDGDSAGNNFPLRIFEQGLDWTIGLAIHGFIMAYKKQHGKRLKRFTLAIDRVGCAYILYGANVILWSK